MYHNTEQEFYNWLAGFVDGDGCFSISLNLRGTSMHVGFSILIGVKYKDAFAIEYLHQRCNVGHIYRHMLDTPDAKISWQTTNMAHSIEIAQKLIPYLVVKKEKAIKFLETALWYQSTCRAVDGKRAKATRVRSNADMKRVVQCAIDLNYDRQVVRYRNKKGMDYWNKTIDMLYPIDTAIQC